jgi:hypothetical protein
VAALSNAETNSINVEFRRLQNHVDKPDFEASLFGEPDKSSIFVGREDSFHPNGLVSSDGRIQPALDPLYGFKICCTLPEFFVQTNPQCQQVRIDDPERAKKI